MLKKIATALCFTAVPFGALAEEGAEPSCAADLSPDSKLIYDETRAAMTPESELDAVLEDKARNLVFDGKISMWSAREAAESAYACLEKSQS